jgi:hypothetical protein
VNVFLRGMCKVFGMRGLCVGDFCRGVVGGIDPCASICFLESLSLETVDQCF